MEPDQLLVVFEGNEFEARLVWIRLDSEGIESQIVGDTLATFAPHYAAPGGTGAVQIWVRECDLEKAKAILLEETDGGTT